LICKFVDIEIFSLQLNKGREIAKKDNERPKIDESKKERRAYSKWDLEI